MYVHTRVRTYVCAVCMRLRARARAHSILCARVYANTGARRRVHVHVHLGRWLRGISPPSDRVPSRYRLHRRGVTDFTGRRANEKLVGCEVARGQRLHPPFSYSRVPLLPPQPSSLSPQDTPRADSRARSLLSDIPTTAGCHEPDARSIRPEKYRPALSQACNCCLGRGRDLRVSYYRIAVRARFHGTPLPSPFFLMY